MVVVVLAACGGSSAKPDGPPPSDGDVDVPTDVGTSGGGWTVDGGAGAITQLAFASTPSGARRAATLYVTNVTGATTQPLVETITGTGLTVSRSTCAGRALVDHDTCEIQVTFAPLAAGALQGNLHLDGSTGPLDLPITATALVPGPGLTANVLSVDFGGIELAQSATADVLVVNNGATTEAVTISLSSAQFSTTNNCPPSLTAGGACTVHVQYSAQTLGLVVEDLVVSTGAVDTHVELRGIGLWRLTVQRPGTGAGMVTSLPSGVSCGTMCTGLFLNSVVLSAAPDQTSRFSGWDGACGGTQSCTLPAVRSQYVSARFDDLASPTITITFAGGAASVGAVQVMVQMNPIFTCHASCVVGVAAGTDVTLAGITPLQFSGWTGDCTGTSCNLGTIVNPRSATATFDLLPHQIGMLIPPEDPTSVAYIGADIAVGDAHAVTRMKTDGTIVYRRQIVSAPVRGIATDASGAVYALTASSVTKLASDGTVSWTTPVVTSSGRSTLSRNSRVQVSADGTVVAIQIAGGVRVLDGAGADRFTVTNLETGSFYVVATAIAPDNTVAVATWDSNFEETHVHRYAVTGTEGTELVFGGLKYDTSLAYDSQGNLDAIATGNARWAAVTVSPTGVAASVFPQTMVAGSALNSVAGLAASSDGHLVAMRAASGAFPFGLHVEVWSPAGVMAWSVDRMPELAPIGSRGISPTAVATDQGNEIAIGGTYTVGLGMPLIARFSVQ